MSIIQANWSAFQVNQSTLILQTVSLQMFTSLTLKSSQSSLNNAQGSLFMAEDSCYNFIKSLISSDKFIKHIVSGKLIVGSTAKDKVSKEI